MRARLIRECDGPNPLFDPRKPVSPSNRRDIMLPIGTILDDPKAWIHCCPDHYKVVRAEPADEECEQIVAEKYAKFASILAARRAQQALAAISSGAAPESEPVIDEDDEETL